MTDDFISQEKQYFPTMKKCDRNDEKQLWECVGEKKYKIKQKQSGRYLFYGERVDKYVTTTQMKATIWTRLGSEKDVCSQGETLQVINNWEKGKAKKKLFLPKNCLLIA